MDPKIFTVGWICALPIELAAALGMLDEKYDTARFSQPSRDDNKYHLGRINVHKVVIICLPSAGTVNAATAAGHLHNTFPALRFDLMVGIGGGVPGKHDIRLGDIVVSHPSKTEPGVIQYDTGKFIHDGKFLRTGCLSPPPKVLLNVVNSLTASVLLDTDRLTQHIEEMFKKHPRTKDSYSYPGREHDHLFKANYIHLDANPTCEECDESHLVVRAPRDSDEPLVHRGLIASGNGVMKDGMKRDQLRDQYDVLCFEMEAGGLMNDHSCLVIRGISDYADSHKNDRWHSYAAVVAAAYAKELLCSMPETANPPAPSHQKLDPGSYPKLPSFSLASGLFDKFMPLLSEVEKQPLLFKPEFPLEVLQIIPSVETRQSSSQLRLPAALRALSSLPSQPSGTSSDKPMIPRSVSMERNDRNQPDRWESRVGEELLFSTSCQSLSEEHPKQCKIDNVECKIYELLNDVHGVSSRRFIFRNLDSPQDSTSIWMPLDNIHIATQESRVDVSWSDCSHIMPFKKNLKITYSCVYKPLSHNRKYILIFNSISVAQDFENVVLHPSLQRFHYTKAGHVTHVSENKTLTVYKHDANMNRSEEHPDPHPDFALLSTIKSVTKSSILFFGGPDLDFGMDTEKDLLELSNMYSLDYKSKLSKPSREDVSSRMNVEGAPDEQIWRKEDRNFSVSLDSRIVLTDLMEMLTGWRLEYLETVPAVVLKSASRLPPKSENLGKAQVMIWKRSVGGTPQLLLRSLTSRNASPWLTTPLSRPSIQVTIPSDNVVCIEAKACLQGPRISRYEMKVATVSGAWPKSLKIQMSFSDADHRSKLYELVDKYVRLPR